MMNYQYKGQHCNGWCQLACEDKPCQCKFDREYERTCIEHPKQVTPAFGVIPQEVLNGIEK
jgi:hypothetical protein